MTPTKRKVLIGTPCYDGRVDVWYANSLLNTINYAHYHNLDVELLPIWVSFDALIQRARNDTVFIALNTDCDDLFWIDSDIEWKPEWLFKLLDYPVDVVGGTYPKKGDAEMYVGNFADMKLGAHGLYETNGLGTGFLRFSRKACQWLWDNSPSYTEYPEKEGEEVKHRKWIFDVQVKNQSMISEDIYVCRRLRDAGFPVYLDTSFTCNHVGGKKYKGNFKNWFDNVAATKGSGIAYLKQYSI